MYLECLKSCNDDVERKVEKGSFYIEEFLASTGYIIFIVDGTHLEGQTDMTYVLYLKTMLFSYPAVNTA